MAIENARRLKRQKGILLDCTFPGCDDSYKLEVQFGNLQGIIQGTPCKNRMHVMLPPCNSLLVVARSVRACERSADYEVVQQ